MSEITLEALRKATAELMKNRIVPEVLTEEQAEEANRIYAEVGLDIRVAAGESVYMFPYWGQPLE